VAGPDSQRIVADKNRREAAPCACKMRSKLSFALFYGQGYRFVAPVFGQDRGSLRPQARAVQLPGFESRAIIRRCGRTGCSRRSSALTEAITDVWLARHDKDGSAAGIQVSRAMPKVLRSLKREITLFSAA